MQSKPSTGFIGGSDTNLLPLWCSLQHRKSSGKSLKVQAPQGFTSMLTVRDTACLAGQTLDLTLMFLAQHMK